MIYTQQQLQAIMLAVSTNFTTEEQETIKVNADGLTDEQLYAYHTLLLWYFDKKAPKFHLLSGAAGTGKSFLVGRFVLCCKAIAAMRFDNLGGRTRFEAVVVAPTHKATGVLFDVFAKLEGVNPAIGTVHSLLHLQPGEYDKETGDRKLVVKINSRKNHFSDYTLGICDEDSMLSEELLYFCEAGTGFKQKVLFVGDRYQLPPVVKSKEELPKEHIEKSPIYLRGYPEVVLVTPVRYDGKIAEFATELRFKIENLYLVDAVKLVLDDIWTIEELIDYLKSEFLFNAINPLNYDCIEFLAGVEQELAELTDDETVQRYTLQIKQKLGHFITNINYALPFPVDEDGTNLVALTGSDWNELLLKEMKDNPDNTRAIAWTNNCINSLAASIKTELYGDAEYHVGDKVMAKDAVVDRVLDERGKLSRVTHLQTCQEATIVKLKIEAGSITSPITENELECDFIYLLLRDDTGKTFKVRTIQTKDIDDMREFFKLERKACKEGNDKRYWAQYYELLDELCVSFKSNTHIQRLAYAGTLTINTAQGSGYENIFINWFNIYGCQNYVHRLRLAYTALTRAKKKAYLLCLKEKYDYFTASPQKKKAAFFDDSLLNEFML